MSCRRVSGEPPTRSLPKGIDRYNAEETGESSVPPVDLTLKWLMQQHQAQQELNAAIMKTLSDM
jgi:hypothetical protein